MRKIGPERIRCGGQMKGVDAMRKVRFVIGSCLLFVCLSQSGCQKVPITGRTQMNLIAPGKMKKTSLKQYDRFLAQNKVVTGTKRSRQLKTVGHDIAKAVEAYLKNNGYKNRIKNYNWEFNLIDKDMVNAWAMPGGKIAFYQGIMDVCRNKNGIAVVMGHEIAHAIARHGNERMSQMMAAKLGGQALSIALHQKPAVTRNLVLQAYGMGAQVGMMLPFSRKHESEADHMGLIFMAMAGYNPREAVDFWQRMKASSDKEKPPPFLSTHPPTHSRIKDLRSHMDEALKYYRKHRNKAQSAK